MLPRPDKAIRERLAKLESAGGAEAPAAKPRKSAAAKKAGGKGTAAKRAAGKAGEAS